LSSFRDTHQLGPACRTADFLVRIKRRCCWRSSSRPRIDLILLQPSPCKGRLISMGMLAAIRARTHRFIYVGGRPLWCGFRTQVRHRVTSEKCQQETHAPQQTVSLFDHLVGARQKRWRNGKPDRFRGLEIDHKLECRRLLDRQIGRLDTFQNLVDNGRRPPGRFLRAS
jgi:hypothetical protein